MVVAYPYSTFIHVPLFAVVEFGETVADAVYHLDVAGVVGVVFDLAPQVLDMGVDGAVVALEAVL